MMPSVSGTVVTGSGSNRRHFDSLRHIGDHLTPTKPPSGISGDHPLQHLYDIVKPYANRYHQIGTEPCESTFS